MAKLTNLELDSVLAKLKAVVNNQPEVKLSKPLELKCVKLYREYKKLIDEREEISIRLKKKTNEMTDLLKSSRYYSVPDTCEEFIKDIESANQKQYDWNSLKRDLIIDNISRNDFDVNVYISKLSEYIINE